MTNWTLLSLLSIGHGICPGEEFYAISKETHHSVHCKLSSDYDRVIVLSDDDEKDVIYGILYDKYIISRKIHRLYFSIPCQEIDTQATPIKKDIAESAKKENDSAVDHPSYYQGKIEVIDFIEDKHLGFNIGNCVKYISRAGKKNPDKLIEDLKKARWYLDREISRIEGVEGK